LNLALLDFARQKRRVVVCLDETQAMPARVARDAAPAHQPRDREAQARSGDSLRAAELDERLAHESIRQLRQRITFQHHMGTLTREETEHYLVHRLAIAGTRATEVFAPAAARVIYRASRGVPRLITSSPTRR